MILKTFECTRDFPKEYKYSLRQDMKRDALTLVRSIYSALHEFVNRSPVGVTSVGDVFNALLAAG